MISSEGQPDEQPDLKKPTALRGVVGVWDRESGDRIKGCDGAWLHATSSLARSWLLEHNQCHSLYLFHCSLFRKIIPAGTNLRQFDLVASWRDDQLR